MKVLLVVVAAVLVLGDCLPFDNIKFKKLFPALSNGVKTAKRQLDDTSESKLLVQMLFLYADNDHNRKLSGSEIASFFSRSRKVTQEEATRISDEMMKEDSDGDKELNNTEALKAVTRLMKSKKQQGM